MINVHLFKDQTEQFLLDNTTEIKKLTEDILYHIDPDCVRIGDKNQRDDLFEELAVTLSLYIVADSLGVEVEDLPDNPLDDYLLAVNMILVHLTLESLVSQGVLTKDGKLNVKLPPDPD